MGKPRTRSILAGSCLPALALLVGCTQPTAATGPTGYEPYSFTALCFSRSAWELVSLTGTLHIDDGLLHFTADGPPAAGERLHVDTDDRLGVTIGMAIVGHSGGTPERYDMPIAVRGWLSRSGARCRQLPPNRLIFILEFDVIPSRPAGGAARD
jgi:hypothetical protein